MQLQRGDPPPQNATEKRIESLRAARKEALHKGDTQRAGDIAEAFLKEFPGESPDYPTPAPPKKKDEPPAEETAPTPDPNPMPKHLQMGMRVQVVGIQPFPGGIAGQRIVQGARVRLVGLTGENSTMNGANGTVVGWDENRTRWNVLMDDGSHKSTKSEHVSLAPSDERALNGAIGWVVGWDSHLQRCQVKLEGGSGKLIQPAHLVKAPEVTETEVLTETKANETSAEYQKTSSYAMEVAQEALKVASDALHSRYDASVLDNQTILQTEQERVAEDLNENCLAWAAQGECTTNAGYMLVSCQTSCRKVKEGLANSRQPA